ncbi:MAG: BrnT family toxin [Betaproteobacteria bacterium]|nr:BrnT family toxin [Betaproteobacteria bacterium]
MRFRYDPAKARANLKKHGVSFADAESVLADPLAVTVEDPDAEDEPRFVTIGLGSAGELLVAVWTERDGECRLISARRATRKEQKHHEG